MIPLLLALASFSPTFAAPIEPTAALADDDDAEDAGEEVARSFDDIADQLQLTADQRTRLSKVVFDYRTAKIDTKAKLAKAKLALRQALVSETLDEKAAQRALDDVGSASIEIQKAKVKLVIEIRKSISYAQFQQLMEIRQQNKAERWKRKSAG